MKFQSLQNSESPGFFGSCLYVYFYSVNAKHCVHAQQTVNALLYGVMQRYAYFTNILITDKTCMISTYTDVQSDLFKTIHLQITNDKHLKR